MKPVSIDRALSDGRFFGAALGEVAPWSRWCAALRAAFGLPLDADMREMFAAVAGNRAPPSKRVRELWAIAGRRSGKSRMAAAIAVYLACFVRHKLSPGERGTVLVVAGSIDQAGTVFGYIKGFLEASPVLRREIASATRNEVTLRNGLAIAVHTNSFRTVRGRTILACVFDEVAFWRDESSATPDIEVYRAVLPALIASGGMLIGISTPYRKIGLLYQKHRDHFGQNSDDVLVVSGASTEFNPLLLRDAIAAAEAADPEAAQAEWRAEFRSDLTNLFDDEMLDGAITLGRPLELPPRPGIPYVAFCDAAGGAAGDAYTLAIGHREGDGLIIDVVRGAVGKFDPDKTTADYAVLLREYGIDAITGDHFAAGWVGGAWRSHGITYRASDKNRSQIYLDTVPLFARGLVNLPDHPRLLRELRLLERRTARNGRETVDHPRGGSDDFANVACGALCSANVSAPALWQRTDLLPPGDAIIAPPRYVDALFAVVVAGERGDLGAVFFSYRASATPPVLILDYSLGHVDPAALHATVGRLWHLIETIAPTSAMVFTQAALANEFVRLGYRRGIERIDDIANDAKNGLLPVAIAPHVGAGRVKLASQARVRTETTPLGILDGTKADDSDPVRVAALVGIAIALDRGRTLSKSKRAA